MGGRVWEGCLPTLAVGYAPWRGGHLGGAGEGDLMCWKATALPP